MRLFLTSILRSRRARVKSWRRDSYPKSISQPRLLQLLSLLFVELLLSNLEWIGSNLVLSV